MAQARLSVDGPEAASVALWDWLRSERELRGRVSREPASGPADAMGTYSDLVVTLASSGTAAVLARSLQVWLTQRRSDIKLTVTGPGGGPVSLDAQRVQAHDVEHLLRAVLGVGGDVSPPTGPQEEPPAASPGPHRDCGTPT